MDEKLSLQKYFPNTSARPEQPYICDYDQYLWNSSEVGREILHEQGLNRDLGTWKTVLLLSRLVEIEILTNGIIAQEILEAVDGISLTEELHYSSPEACARLYESLHTTHCHLDWIIRCGTNLVDINLTRTGLDSSRTSGAIIQIYAPSTPTTPLPQLIVGSAANQIGLSSQEFLKKSTTTAPEEIAFLLHFGVARLWQFEAMGWENTAPPPIHFEISTTANIFAQVAKQRALSILWQLIIREFGLTPSNSPVILADTSSERATEETAYMTLMGTICKSIGAVMGGASHIIVQANDLSSPESLARSLRLSRNTQLIAHYESKIGDIIDPVGGSWYAEKLTRDFMVSAWEIFQKSQQQQT